MRFFVNTENWVEADTPEHAAEKAFNEICVAPRMRVHRETKRGNAGRVLAIITPTGNGELAPEVATAYRTTAKSLFEESSDDELEIDDNARVSQNDEGGAWVAAWVYVRDDEAGLCSECREPADNGEGYDGKCGNCADKEAGKQ